MIPLGDKLLWNLFVIVKEVAKPQGWERVGVVGTQTGACNHSLSRGKGEMTISRRATLRYQGKASEE